MTKEVFIASGIVFGIVFGFLLKRSRFCAAGLTRDIVLENRWYNAVYIPAIIMMEAFIYFLMVGSDVIPGPKMADFSLFRIGLGSLMFGVGAVLCNGCIVSSLLKCGDGRLIGWISVPIFTLSAYTAKGGWLASTTKSLDKVWSVPDTLLANLPISPIVLAGVGMIIMLWALRYVYNTTKLGFTIPGRYTGWRHIVFEKIWPKEMVVMLIGIWMALGFLFSNLAGRNGGFGITTPLVSWFEFFTAGKSLGWASLFVLGIIIGAFITAWLGGEFSIVKPRLGPIVLTAIGSVLMGIGAVWASGCFIGNVMVGTAQFSMKAWYSTIFIVGGVWLATFIMIKMRTFTRN